ncbi:MAG: electron transfer flavoprotein subunit beta/FixA family protein [Bdellovibrionales bacterium]
MAIFVCIKQVPDTETKIQIKDDNSGIKTDSVKWVVNPYDEFAVEEALKLKTSTGADKIYAITLGPQKRAQDSLRIALAMGCDEGVIVDYEGPLDSLASAKAIKAAILKTAEPSLILTGKSSIDDNSQAFTQQLAALFEAPHATAVTKITADASTIEIEREIEGGAKEVYSMTGLSVIGANKGLNTPRYPSLPGIMKAKKKPVHVYSTEDLSVDTNSTVVFTDYQMPAPQPPTKILSGEISAQVDELVNLLKNESKVL